MIMEARLPAQTDFKHLWDKICVYEGSHLVTEDGELAICYDGPRDEGCQVLTLLYHIGGCRIVIESDEPFSITGL